MRVVFIRCELFIPLLKLFEIGSILMMEEQHEVSFNL